MAPPDLSLNPPRIASVNMNTNNYKSILTELFDKKNRDVSSVHNVC